MQVDEIIRLMEGMNKNRIALLEHEGLKLASSPPDRGDRPMAASGLMPSQIPQAPTPVETDPVKAMHAAREAAARLAEQRLAISQAQTVAARKRAAKGGIGPKDTGALVQEVFKSTKKERPSSKRT